ncbi:MAG: hypothetical protein K2L50_01585 [Bacteroidales bacterium]|nr:hypothetical protein [Bacteroidales bacterium]
MNKTASSLCLSALLAVLPACLHAARYSDTLTAAETLLAPASRQASDTTVSERRQERKERKEDRKEALKEEGEHLREEIKDAAQEVTEDIKNTFQEKKESIKETFSQTKENLVNWFNENIKANTVGDFAEIQRQNNQNFADYVRADWSVFPLEIRERNPMAEGSFFSDKAPSKASQAEEPYAIDVEGFIAPLPLIEGPVPENYYEEAGSDAVAALLSKQQFIPLKFYGKDINIYFNPSLRNISLGKGTGKHIAKFWLYLSDQDFNPVLFQLFQTKEELQLNDYQYYLLVRRFAEKLFAKNKNGEDLLFTVFMLNQTGYDARLGRLTAEGTNRFVILLPFFEQVYSLPFITIGTNNYYLAESPLTKKEMQGKVKVYEKAFATASHPFSIRINPQNTGIAPLYGKFHGYTFNERLAEMQADMPAGPFELSASAEFNPLMQKTFLYKLKPELDSLVQKKQDQNLQEVISERESQEMQLLQLLSFLNRNLSSQAKQSAKLNGYYLYPDLMFMKKGSGDILDRSLLLCLIANRILDIPAVLLVYPNYAMAAVCLKESPQDTESPFAQSGFVDIDGKRYYLCGPLPKTVQEPRKAKIFRW